MADQNLNNSAGMGDLVSPSDFAQPSTSGSDNLVAPSDFGQDIPSQENAGVWNTFKANLGARVDAVLAAHMQEEGDTRSRYAMQRAQRTNQEAAIKESSLSGIQKTAVMGMDIGTGLAATAVDPALGVGYFGAQGYADELRNQAAQPDFNRYDTDTALGVAGAQAALGAVLPGVANKAVGAIAPKIAQGVGYAANKVLPAAGRAAAAIPESVAEPLGYLAGEKVGQVVSKYAGKGAGAVLRDVGNVSGEAVNKGARLASYIATSKAGQSAIGGGAAGVGMQGVSNIANGRDLTEGMGEAALAGMAGGTMVHAGMPVARTLARRLPTTFDIAKNNALGRARGYEPTPEEASVETTIPNEVNADEGAINPEANTAREQGPIPAPETAAPVTDTTQPGSIPGAENLSADIASGMYGNGPQGAFRNVQAGQGFGPGAPEPAGNNTQSIGDIIKGGPGTLAHRAVDVFNAFKQEGFGADVRPKAVKNMSDAEINAKAQGIHTSDAIVRQAKATEGSLDLLQQGLENMQIGSPEYNKAVADKTALAAQSGQAASHARANALALDVDMPASAQFHNITLHEGIANENTPRNVATDVHGIPQSKVTEAHRAILESQGVNMLGLGNERSEAQKAAFQTYESHHNATRDAWQKANAKVETVRKKNSRLLNETLEQYKLSGDEGWNERVGETKRAWKDYEQMMTDVGNGKAIDVDELQSVSRVLNDNFTAMGIHEKMGNILGDTGTFDPIIDLDAWQNFNKRTRLMHGTAPKGAFKDMVNAKEIGVEGINGNPLSWVKTGARIGRQIINKDTAGKTLASGAKMARENANRPTRRDLEETPVTDEEAKASQAEVERSLKAGDAEYAKTASQNSLEESGITTGNVDLGATPAAEINQRQFATPAQHAELGRRNHPAAGDDTLTRETADLLIAHDDMVRQNGQPATPDNEAVAQEASTPSRLGEPAPEAAPVEEPQGTSFSEGNNRPGQLGEPEAPVTPEEVPTETPVEAPEATPAETTTAPGAFAEGNTRPAQNAPEAAPVEPTAPKGQGVPQKPKSTLSAEEGRRPATKAQNQQMENLGIKPEHEVNRQAAEDLIAEAKAKEAAPKVEDLKTDEPVDTKVTEVKEGESEAARNKRVTEMAKQLVDKKVEKVLNAPIKQLSKDVKEANKMRADAHRLRNGINDVISMSKDIANKRFIPHADVLQAVMNREGGIEATFSNGYGKDAVKSRINDAITEYTNKMTSMAKQSVKESREIVRDRLGARKVGSTAEEIETLARNNLKAMGFAKDVIEAAVNKAQEISERPTVRQIAEAAKTIRRQNVESVKRPLNKLKEAVNTAKMESKRAKLAVKDATEALEALKTEATKSKEAIEKSKDKAASRKIHKADVEAVKQATKKLEAAQSAQKQADRKVDFHNKNLLDAQLSGTKADAELQESMKKADEFVAKHEQEVTEARAEVKKEMSELAKDMPTESVEQFGKLIGEDLPDHVTDINDVDYISWKDRMDVAAKELENRNLNKDARFLREFSRVVDKGLRRKIELPDAKHQDLILSNKDYRDLMTAFNESRVGRDANVQEAGNVHMGTMGTKLGALLLGDSRAEFRLRKFNKTEQGIKAERSKVLHEKTGPDDNGLSSVGISEKPAPKKPEPAIKTEPATQEKPAPVKPKVEPEYVRDQRNEKIISAARSAFDENTPEPVYKVARNMTKDLDEGQLTSLIKAIGKAKSANRNASPGTNRYLSALGNEVDRIRKQLKKGK